MAKQPTGAAAAIRHGEDVEGSGPVLHEPDGFGREHLGTDLDGAPVHDVLDGKGKGVFALAQQRLAHVVVRDESKEPAAAVDD